MDAIPPDYFSKGELLQHIEPLEEEMPCDFREPHRYDYFRVLPVSRGGSTHYNDFTAHLVFPGQAHLMRHSGQRYYLPQGIFLAALPKALYTVLHGRHHLSIKGLAISRRDSFIAVSHASPISSGPQGIVPSGISYMHSM